MSWGEHSCASWGICEIANMKDCNKKCNLYVVNLNYEEAAPIPTAVFDEIGKLEEPKTYEESDTASRELYDEGPSNIDVEEKELSTKQTPTLHRSTLDRFTPKKELVILKGCLFEIQKLSPLKVTLKLKKKLTQANIDTGTQMVDGVFVFVQGDEVQDLAKVFRENIIALKATAQKAIDNEQTS